MTGREKARVEESEAGADAGEFARQQGGQGRRSAFDAMPDRASDSVRHNLSRGGVPKSNAQQPFPADWRVARSRSER